MIKTYRIRYQEKIKNHVVGKYDWVRYMRRNTIDLEKDNQVAVVGPTGTGKTLSASCVAIMTQYDWHEADITNPTPEMIQQMLDFVKNNIMFDTEEMFSVVKVKHPINTSFVFEEIGVNIDATQWQTKINRLMKYLAQTIRHRRYNIFYTVPNLSSSQKQNRILMPIMFQTVYIDRKAKKCFIQPRFYPVDPRTGESLSKNGYPLWVDGKPLNLWGIPLLPKEVVAAYERRKMAFTQKLYEGMGGKEGEVPEDVNRPTHFCPLCKGVWKSKLDNPKTCAKCRNKSDNYPPVPIKYPKPRDMDSPVVTKPDVVTKAV